jgi:hypothetical protein
MKMTAKDIDLEDIMCSTPPPRDHILDQIDSAVTGCGGKGRTAGRSGQKRNRLQRGHPAGPGTPGG